MLLILLLALVSRCFQDLRPKWCSRSKDTDRGEDEVRAGAGASSAHLPAPCPPVPASHRSNPCPTGSGPGSAQHWGGVWLARGGGRPNVSVMVAMPAPRSVHAVPAPSSMAVTSLLLCPCCHFSHARSETSFASEDALLGDEPISLAFGAHSALPQWSLSLK